MQAMCCQWKNSPTISEQPRYQCWQFSLSFEQLCVPTLGVECTRLKQGYYRVGELYFRVVIYPIVGQLLNMESQYKYRCQLNSQQIIQITALQWNVAFVRRGSNGFKCGVFQKYTYFSTLFNDPQMIVRSLTILCFQVALCYNRWNHIVLHFCSLLARHRRLYLILYHK